MTSPLSRLCQVLFEVLQDNPAADQAGLVARAEDIIARDSELAAALKNDLPALQINKGSAKGFQTQVEEGGTVFIEGTHYHLSNPQKFRATLESVLQKIQNSQSKSFDFEPYLQSILSDKDYLEWQDLYIPTTVEGRKSASQANFSRRLKLRVETIRYPKAGEESTKEKDLEQKRQVEQWDVLLGLRRYARSHVLLVGKPGSGKSTSLERLLWEEVDNASNSPNAKIPVLVKLRRCTSTIEELIQDFLCRHQLPLGTKDIENLLQQGRFLLLLDGLNEIPDSFRTEVSNFRDRYRTTTSMIFSTRDLSAGGTLGIVNQLKMLPLTDSQMREFVQGYLGEAGNRLLQQLKDDQLREFAETPLLLWMLCRVFAQNDQVPANLGFAFREFTQLYDQQIQEDAPAESRDQWPKLLRYFAFALMHDKESPDFRLSTSRQDAENLLTVYLQQEGRTNARDCAERWLQDLLDYHLLQPVRQPNFEEHIEFRHQLIQEYYVAEYLLQLLPVLSDEQLKRDYLNYQKWTEPFVLMLALVGDEAQSLRIVKLAKDVDFMLLAELAGKVRSQLHTKSIEVVSLLMVPKWLKIRLLGRTRCNVALNELKRMSQASDKQMCLDIIDALGEIATPEAISTLKKFSGDPFESICRNAIYALGKIANSQAYDELIDIWKSGKKPSSTHALSVLSEELRNESIILLDQLGASFINDDPAQLCKKYLSTQKKICQTAPVMLNRTNYGGSIKLSDDICEGRNIDSARSVSKKTRSLNFDRSVQELDRTLNGTDPNVCQSAAMALRELGYERFVPEKSVQELIRALDEKDPNVRQSAAVVLGKTRLKKSVSALIVPALIKALKDEDPGVRQSVTVALRKFGSRESAPALIKALKDEDPGVRQSAAVALRKIRSEASIPALIELLDDRNLDVRRSAAMALRKISPETSISVLIKSIEDEDGHNLGAAAALSKVSSEEAVPALIKALDDRDVAMRQLAVKTLKNIGSEEAVPALIKALDDRDVTIRQLVVKALKNIGSEKAVSALISALEDDDPNVRRSAAEGLGKFNLEKALPALVTALEDENRSVCRSVTAALKKISTEKSLSTLIENLDTDSNYAFKVIAKMISDISPQKAVTEIMRVLLFSEKDVSQKASVVLMGAEDMKFIFELRKELESFRLQSAGASQECLKLFDDDQPVERILDNLTHPNPNLRDKAALHLGKIQSEKSVNYLIDALDDSVSFVRSSAAEALGKICSNQALLPLTQALRDPASGVRWRAAEALGRIASAESIYALTDALKDSDLVVREAAAEALGNIDGRRTACLIPLLTEMITDKEGREVILAISYIQSQSKLYNYEVASGITV